MTRPTDPDVDHLGRPRVVVTGLGAVSPIGVGVKEFTRGLRGGASGTRPLDWDERDRERVKSRVAAVVPGWDPTAVLPAADVKRLPRLVPMALAAALEAARMARLPVGDDPRLDTSRRIGVVLGTGAGGIDFTLDQARSAMDPERLNAPGLAGGLSLWTITNATHGNLAGELSIRLGARGPSLCVSTGCASASDAIGLAIDRLRSPAPDAPGAMIVVGADAHVRWETIRGMELLGVITTRPCATADDAARTSRPFDASRDGFVLGEGAWALVLERSSWARRREARVLAEAAGAAATCDAHHRVRPAPDMAESARAINSALADAGLSPSDITHVHYHGTATELNDRLETAAVKLALGDEHARRVVGTSVKSMIGHPQGACGAASAVATIAAANALHHAGDPFAPPTINLDEPGEGCDLDYTPNEPRPLDPDADWTALVNCLAFGAKNSAVVLRSA